jgi:tRNA 2-selenouridine synthase
MPKKISIKEFLELTGTLSVIDVRSPAEYEQAHIPGAVNIPLFNNEERKQVGTTYKRKGKESAVLQGLDYIGLRMAEVVKQARKQAQHRKILVHCWRGGMRSASMAWLFETIGLQAFVLDGGYKAYRHFIREQFSYKAKIFILGGSTGSGKTAILQELQKQGEQFLDIEGIAHHKGSVFGPLGQESQPSNEQFENNLAVVWQKFDLTKPIWIEDESRQLGMCGIPNPLFVQMREAIVIKVIIPKNERVKRLVKEYGHFEKELLAEQIEKIRERLGGEFTNRALKALEKNDMATVADLTLIYYDKAYSFGISKRNPEKVFEIELERDAPKENALAISKFIKKM